MEEIIPVLKVMLKEAIKIDYDESSNKVILRVDTKTRGILADPQEVITMFKMFGSKKTEIPMDIIINNEIQTITIKARNLEDFSTLKEITEKIWDDAVDMLKSVISGDYNSIKDIPNIDD